jgi:hypothetical protein
MTTKYVMNDEGEFALINKMTGVEHTTLAHDVGGAHRLVSAGFLTYYRGELTTYGKSVSTGKESRVSDARVIQEAIETGKVRIDHREHQWGYAAGNHECMMAPDNEVATIELLMERKILGDDD